MITFCSCSEIEEFPIDLPSSNLKTRSYSGDGEYDALGYGCDAAKNLFSAKLSVIDNELIKEVYNDKVTNEAITPDLVQYGSMKYNAGATSVDYLKSVSETKNITFKL